MADNLARQLADDGADAAAPEPRPALRPVTEGDTPAETPVETPAGGNGEKSESTREGRASARESTTEAKDSQPEAGVTLGVGAPEVEEPSGPTLWERVKRSWTPVEQGGTGTWRRPELWDVPREPLREVVAYLTSAPWTTDKGWIRTLGRVYVPLGVLIVASCYGLAWIAQRPARFAAFVLLLAITSAAISASQ